MVIREEQRDLFSIPHGYYFAHCISRDYKLGAGIAVEFDKRYDMKRKLNLMYEDKSAQYDALLVDNVFNLVTKEKYYHKPTYQSLKRALEYMKDMMIDFHIDKVAMPRIGCGLDKLDWDRVKEIIEDVFCNLPGEIVVCYL